MSEVGSIFMDSGAYSLYRTHVLKLSGKRMGLHGRPLAPPPIRRGHGDFSFFTLKRDSEFRKYCDFYAGFIRKMQGTGILVANVDVITRPDLTWEVQKYFEKEHGLFPIPVIHNQTKMEWAERYLTGKYPIIGLGGPGIASMGEGIIQKLRSYQKWCDEFFFLCCPKTNQYKPIVRVHGFAVTAWKFILRWPWWSVDSSTFARCSHYGWLLLPKWSDDLGWRYDIPPFRLHVSRMPDRRNKIFLKAGRTAKEIGEYHYDTCHSSLRRIADRWLQYVGVPIGCYRGEDVKEIGVSSSGPARAKANLIYFKDLEESLPKWPHPLNIELIARSLEDRNRFNFLL